MYIYIYIFLIYQNTPHATISRLQGIIPVSLKCCKRIAIWHCDKYHYIYILVYIGNQAFQIYTVDWPRHVCLCMFVCAFNQLQTMYCRLMFHRCSWFIILVTSGCLTWAPQTPAMPILRTGPRYGCCGDIDHRPFTEGLRVIMGCEIS